MIDLPLEHEAAVRRVACGVVTPNDHRFDDVFQEGLIAFWKTYDPTEDVSDPLAVALYRAKLRMRNMAHTDPKRTVQPTGHEPMPGHVAPTTTAILDKPVGESGSSTLGELLAPSVEPLEGVELAYHHGEIAEALNRLSAEHRDYVVRRLSLIHI